MKKMLFAAGLAVVSFTPAWGFGFNDIRCWIGEGTNRCAVVVDFNDGGTGDRSFAWGYRWNGMATNVTTILKEITARDSRLKMFASSSQYGSYIEAFAYDADADGGTFERVWNSETYAYDHVKSDADDIFPVTEDVYSFDPVTSNHVYTGIAWMQLAGTGTAFEDVVFADTPNGVDYTNPEDGQWICWRLCPYESVSDADWNPIGYECIETSPYVPVAAVRAFGMEDIQSWLGHGTNSCAIVVDFNEGSVEPCSFVWGYRWNGEAPSVKTILDEITARDQRLKMFASVDQYGSFIDAFAYDVDGDGGTFERIWNSEANAYDCVKSDSDDLFPATVSTFGVDDATGHYIYSGTSWMQLAGTGFMFDDVAFAETPNGVDLTQPENGQWICWRLCPYVSEYDADWNTVGYECTIDSEHLPLAAEPRLVSDGKITKSNTKSGQTATWKAVAALGSVFSHWKGGIVDTLGLSANALRNPTLKFKMPAELEEPTAVFVPIDQDGITALWLEGDQPLEAGVLVTNLFLRDDSLSYVTATVKGLPSGMKFNAADLSFGGKPKKDGTYVLTVTAKNASGYQMSQAIKLSVGTEDPSVEVPEIAYTPYYPLTLTVADGGGTVKGTGVYAANKVVTASAVADKGYVFAGWFTDETCTVPATVGEFDYRTPTVKMSVPDVRYLVAKFVKKGADTDPVANLACAGVDESGSLTMMVGVRVDASVAITCDSLSLPSYSSKSFPAGVSVSKTTGEIVGVPTKAGTFNAQVMVSNASGKRTLPLTINVLPMPEWANGSFVGLVEQQDVEPGSATLTVGKTGKISGKVELCGTNWTFSASAYDAVQFADGTTNLTITGEAKYVDAKKNASVRDIALSVNMPTNGTWNIATVTGSFGDAEYGAYRVIWSDSKLAKDELSANWTGTYLYATDAGDILTLKIQNNGSVTFAGTLANGRSVKGSTSLLHEDAALIRSPFVIAYAPAASVKVKVDKKTETMFCPAFCDVIRFKYDAPEPGGPAVRR
jgi:hypothetical protein